MPKSRHISYYVNVGQVSAVVGAVLFGLKALDLEAQKAGVEQRSLAEIIQQDIVRARKWFGDKFLYRQYRHY